LSYCLLHFNSFKIAAAFLWFYWFAVPNWTVNHIVLGLIWTVFIIVGTLVFEEGGLRGPDEFGQKYAAYANKVNPFFPSIWSLKRFVGLVHEKDN
jgi:protein-S-isoprenylcysteine O-methyltransferase Ste14